MQAWEPLPSEPTEERERREKKVSKKERERREREKGGEKNYRRSSNRLGVAIGTTDFAEKVVGDLGGRDGVAESMTPLVTSIATDHETLVVKLRATQTPDGGIRG